MLSKVREAEQLMKKALGLLDEAGELRAAPHLDMALHELKQVFATVSIEGEAAGSPAH